MLLSEAEKWQGQAALTQGGGLGEGVGASILPKATAPGRQDAASSWLLPQASGHSLQCLQTLIALYFIPTS